MKQYAKSPHGKRLVRCGCNDTFDPRDEGTECFEEGPASVICNGCGKYPWYNKKAAQSGSQIKKERGTHGI